MVETKVPGAASGVPRGGEGGPGGALASLVPLLPSAMAAVLAGLTALWVVTGPLAPSVASVAGQVRAAHLDKDIPSMLPWLLGAMVALQAWSAWGSVAQVATIPLLSSDLSLRARLRDLADNVLLAALLLGLGSAALAYAFHLVAASGGDPLTAAPWIASVKGLDRFYDDPAGVVPAGSGLVALALLQAGMASLLAVPGTAAHLLARPPRRVSARVAVRRPAGDGAAR